MSGKPEGGRWELKYVFPMSLRNDLFRIVGDNIAPDPHGQVFPELGTRGYDVHSLYFDTPDYQDYTNRMCGQQVRVRLRVRTYGKPGDKAPVYLEDKRKVDNWVLKQRVKVGDADTWIASRDPEPWATWGRRVTGKKAIIAQHFLRRVVDEGRRPVSVVHYRRECFVDRNPTDAEVRLTMDHHVSSTTAPGPTDFYAPPDQLLIPEGYVVLELKFNHTQPGWMRKLVRELHLVSETVSKFGLSVAYGLRADHPNEVRLNTPVGALRAVANKVAL